MTSVSSFVLLIEDDVWLAQSYKQVLERRDIECEIATNSEEAIELIEVDMPNVIVADILLADQTVISLLHELQSYDDTKLIPVILCSSLAETASLLEDQLHEYGVVAVLDKATLTPEQLAMTVQEHL